MYSLSEKQRKNLDILRSSVTIKCLDNPENFDLLITEEDENIFYNSRRVISSHEGPLYWQHKFKYKVAAAYMEFSRV